MSLRFFAVLAVASFAACATEQKRPPPSILQDPDVEQLRRELNLIDDRASAFGERMTRPKPDPDNRPILYTDKAVFHHIEGLALVGCVITEDGAVEKVKMLRGLPFMDDAILETVSSWRFKPATRDGKPIRVKYILPVRLEFPIP